MFSHFCYTCNRSVSARRSFSQNDKHVQKDCPSGELSRRKFLSIYSTLFPEGKAGPFYEHVFRTFDEDGSGRIDFKEFLQVRGLFSLCIFCCLGFGFRRTKSPKT